MDHSEPIASNPRDFQATAPSAGAHDARHALSLRINGRPHTLHIEPWVTLLDLLRDRLDLAGTKKGCDHGQCGACTVLVDGRRINACLTLAVMQEGREVTTVEGLAEGDALHPLQKAFIEHDAFQCGYCTPGQLCSAVGLMNEGEAASRDDIRELMSGNLCRCGAYPQIVQAVGEVMGIDAPANPYRRIVIGTVPA
jgi:xanthine dehydrogenase YagT iron-sulfur-binding subunit